MLLRGSVSKSGRDRDIEIIDPFQRHCLDHAKKIARPGATLGWPRKTYKQSVNHYNYLMAKKLGITGAHSDCVGHGLRAEFSENMALRLGFIPPTLGGAHDQSSMEVIKQAQSQVTRAMGHNRTVTTGAYYGSVRLKPMQPGRKVCGMVIGDGLIANLHINPTPLKNDAGEFLQLTAVQRDRSAVHIEIDRDGQTHPVGIWRISGYCTAELQAIEGIDVAQRQLLSEKLGLVLSKMGWIS